MGVDAKTLMLRRKGIGRQAATLLLLLAFALQAYLTQTHIHRTMGEIAPVCASWCIGHAPLGHSSHDKPADCPLCQAIVHAGAFFAPAIPAVLLLHVWVQNLVLPARVLTLSLVPARDGLSRAPPR